MFRTPDEVQFHFSLALFWFLPTPETLLLTVSTLWYWAGTVQSVRVCWMNTTRVWRRVYGQFAENQNNKLKETETLHRAEGGCRV